MQSPTLFFVYVFWLMKMKGMNIFRCLKNPLATNPKLATKEKKINLEGCLSINRRSKLHAVLDCLFFFSCCCSARKNWLHIPVSN